MYQAELTRSNKEIARIMAIAIQNTFKNLLLLGDIHSPMNQVSEVYKITSAHGDIVGGFTIYHGGRLPTVIFPYGQTEIWSAIRAKVNGLGYPQINLVYPIGLENAAGQPPPFLGWNEYRWTIDFVDIAMRLEKDEIAVESIDHLPEIRAATSEDAAEIKEFLDRYSMEDWFHPLQLQSELAVVALDKERIIGYAGTHFETPYTVQIGNVTVDEHYRGKGLGKALTTAVVLGILRTRRIPTLFVNEHNTVAQKLYETLGFAPFDRFQFAVGIQA